MAIDLIDPSLAIRPSDSQIPLREFLLAKEIRMQPLKCSGEAARRPAHPDGPETIYGNVGWELPPTTIAYPGQLGTCRVGRLPVKPMRPARNA